MIGCTMRPVTGAATHRMGKSSSISAPRVLEDPADVGVLEREAELDAQEAETHVPDLPETERRLSLSFRFRPCYSGSGRAAVPPPAASRHARENLPLRTLTTLSITSIAVRDSFSSARRRRRGRWSARIRSGPSSRNVQRDTTILRGFSSVTGDTPEVPVRRRRARCLCESPRNSPTSPARARCSASQSVGTSTDEAGRHQGSAS